MKTGGKGVFQGLKACPECCRAASVEAVDLSMPMSYDTLPDDDREARAAQSQQEQGQVSPTYLTPTCPQQLQFVHLVWLTSACLSCYGQHQSECAHWR